MSRCAWSLGLRTLLVSLAACGSGLGGGQPEPLTIASISPSEMSSEGTVMLVLQLQGMGTHIDYGRGSAHLPAATISIGTVLKVAGEVLPGSVVQAELPPGLPPGSYDVGVQLSDGRQVSLPAAITIWATPVREVPDGGLPDGGLPDGGEPDGGEPDGGTPDSGTPDSGTPDGGEPVPEVTGFSFQTIGDQVQGVPFAVSIQALGPGAANFHGYVDLWSIHQVTPWTAGPFNDGGVVVEVVIQTAGDNVTITAKDAEGRTGTSNPFRVSAP